jgi:hypothetical protein
MTGHTIIRDGMAICPECKSSNLKIDIPEDRYDRELPTTCRDCEWEGYTYDES